MIREILGALVAILSVSVLITLFVYPIIIALATIWALNTLFNLRIPYDFWTILAVMILMWVMGAIKIKFEKK